MRIRAVEWAWGVFLTLVLAKSLIAPEEAIPASLLAGWLALLAGAAWTAQATRGPEPPTGKRRWAWVFYPLAMNAAFMMLGPTVKRITHWRADPVLEAIDAALVGGNLSLRLEPWVGAAANEVFSFAYMFFMLLLFASQIGYFLRPSRLVRFYDGLFTLYAIGFMGYLLVPAAGPYVAMAGQFSVPIEGGLFTHLNIEMVTRGSNHVDVFPSLHIAVSTYIWVFLVRDRPRLGWAIAPLVFLLWLSTLYLRYHYLIDILAGFSLAAFCLRIGLAGVGRSAPQTRSSRLLEPQ